MTLTTEDLTAISDLLGSNLDDNFAKQTERIKIQFEMQDTKINTRFFIQDARYETLTNKIEKRLDDIDTRLDGIDTRLDGMDARLDGMDMRFDSMDKRFDGIDTRLDGMDKRFIEIDKRFDEVEFSIKRINIGELENRIHPVLKDVVNIIKTTSERYHKEADKIKKIEEQICAVTAASTNHARRLDNLEQAQAV